MVINFTGVVLKSVERNHKGGKLKLSAELTKTVAKAFDWDDLPETYASGDPGGFVQDAEIHLTPKQEDLFGDAGFKARVQSVGKFQIVRLELENSRGKGFRREIHFEAKFVAPQVAAVAESWLMSVGDGKSTMKVDGTVIKSTNEEPEE